MQWTGKRNQSVLHRLLFSRRKIPTKLKIFFRFTNWKNQFIQISSGWIKAYSTGIMVNMMYSSLIKTLKCIEFRSILVYWSFYESQSRNSFMKQFIYNRTDSKSGQQWGRIYERVVFVKKKTFLVSWMIRFISNAGWSFIRLIIYHLMIMWQWMIEENSEMVFNQLLAFVNNSKYSHIFLLQHFQSLLLLLSDIVVALYHSLRIKLSPNLRTLFVQNWNLSVRHKMYPNFGF